MGSVVIVFLPILLPYLLICAVAGKFGYDPLDVLFGPFELTLNGIVEVFFGGDGELFMSTFQSFVDSFVEFVTENEETLVSTSEKIAEFLGVIL